VPVVYAGNSGRIDSSLVKRVFALHYVRFLISRFMSPEDLSQLLLVCKSFNQFVPQAIWQLVTLKQFPNGKLKFTSVWMGNKLWLDAKEDLRGVQLVKHIFLHLMEGNEASSPTLATFPILSKMREIESLCIYATGAGEWPSHFVELLEEQSSSLKDLAIASFHLRMLMRRPSFAPIFTKLQLQAFTFMASDSSIEEVSSFVNSVLEVCHQRFQVLSTALLTGQH
jgi:hypothetical protein